MIDIVNLNYQYGSKVVFNDLNFQCSSGKIFGLFGNNGSGKSTLLKLISGLLFCKREQIKVLNYTPKFRQPDFLKEIFFIPEEFHLPDVNIETLLKYYSRFYPKFDKSFFYKLVNEMDVPIENRFSKMSLGQKKKAVICFGLASNTSILLMDEPTNGLDILSKSIYKEIMLRVSTENRCIIISTHQAKDLEQLITDVIIIQNTKLQLNTTIDRIERNLKFIISDDRVEEVLYFEILQSRYHTILKNNDVNSKSKVDLELLFKSIIQNKLKTELIQ